MPIKLKLGMSPNSFYTEIPCDFCHQGFEMGDVVFALVNMETGKGTATICDRCAALISNIVLLTEEEIQEAKEALFKFWQDLGGPDLSMEQAAKSVNSRLELTEHLLDTLH